MKDDVKQPVSTSSIVMRAIDATTFSELQAFTKDLESRPIERLLRDVAELVLPSESKAHIVSYVIAAKHRQAGVADRRTIADSLSATLKHLPPGEQRDRVEAVMERVRAQESC